MKVIDSDQNALDPLEGIETIFGNQYSNSSPDQNALDPLEGIETFDPDSALNSNPHQNALDPLEGIETNTIHLLRAVSNLQDQNALDPLEGIETFIEIALCINRMRIRMHLTR